MKQLTEREALARLQRLKRAYQRRMRVGYEHAARPCRTCPTKGMCCTDAHFVNVQITRLEAIAIRETILRTPRLTDDEKRSVFERARAAVERYGLTGNGAQTFACPLFDVRRGCLVHQRAKPAPCIQHACYDRWEDVPPIELQWRVEYRVERLNEGVYGTAWAWLSLPVWLKLIDPWSDGAELRRLESDWRMVCKEHRANRTSPHDRRILPVLKVRFEKRF
ncbi:MAG: hypothetical protein C4334_13000 [Pyrinomonas sp.]|uniref:hypothetical protein n=1 Tax=Pyrinomonas sp. TaxID=2080306 RepID=UPI0033320A53